MLAASLEDRFRAALGERAHAGRDEAIGFAVAFARLLVRVLPDDVSPAALHGFGRALADRTDLTGDDLDTLVALALAPEHRAEVREDELVAFGARFGPAAERAMRGAVADEVDLEGFAARYGANEALLLLDSQFALAAADAHIDPAEIARLHEAATRLQLDPMLVGLLFRKHDVRQATGDRVFDLAGLDEVVIGRSPPAHVRLPDPQVAPAHARLVRSPVGWRVLDLDSGRPTLLRGVAVRGAPLVPGDELRVGPYRLVLATDGEQLVVFGATAISALSVRDLTRALPSPAGPQPLLDDVSFTVFSGEVVALLGPSGAGKTTLLHAIAGIAPPDAGHVQLDGADFHALLASDRSVVGIVPQDDLLHGELTVEESLRYAARLRLAPDVPEAAVQSAVARVLDQLGLTEVRGARIGNSLARGISGGQRKRVNLGQELITRTTRVLFLDEPTSGLDPATSQDIVRQVRHLADDGRIVFLVTHDVAPSLLDLVDHVLVLAPGGRVAWFGPPREAIAHFGVGSVDAIFALLPTEDPRTWAERYRLSPAFRKYVRTREHILGLAPTEEAEPPAAASPRSFLTQTAALTGRYARVKARDWVGTGVLLAQAPLLGLAFTLVFPRPEAGTMFVLVLSALWFGASAAVRELIAERPIWRRESRVGLRLGPYLASKVLVLSALVALQCATLVLVMHAGLGMGAYGVDLGMLGGVAVATGLTGMTIGLLVSAAFSSTEAAVGSLPLVLIPQIAFGGLLVTVRDMTASARAISDLMVVRYAFEAALKTAERLEVPARGGQAATTSSRLAYLWEFGFRASSDNTAGRSPAVLVGVLALFGVAFLAVTTVLTRRSRHGS